MEHRVAVVGCIDRGREGPVAGADDLCSEREFQATVAHAAIVDDTRGGTEGRIEVLGDQQVLAHTVVELQATAQVTVEHAEVHAKIGCRGALPTQLWIRQVVVGEREVGSAGRVLVEGAVTGHEVSTRTLVHVAVDAVGGTQLEVVEPGEVTEPSLFGHVPACTHRPERMVLLLGIEAEEVSLVPTDAAGDVVAVLEIISGIGVE